MKKLRKMIGMFVTLVFLSSMLMPGIVLAGSVVNLSDSSINITEGDSSVYVDQNVTVTSSASFDDGYVRFSVADANAGDSFSVVSNANPNANGAISFSGSKVYLGDGSGTTVIGIIDSTENGQNGKALKINFSSPMANSGFENGSAGWTLNNSEYRMSGDTLDNIYEISTNILTETDGNKYLNLNIRGHVSVGYGTGHGPTATSSYFEANPGDTIAFDWKAARTSDYYDVYAYLINDATGQKFQVLYQRGATISTWQKKEIVLNSSYLSSYSDKLKFLFVCGTYDATGGKAVGSVMDIDNVRVVKQYATASVVDTVISQIKYQNTSDDPAATRTITVKTSDENGTTDSDTRNVNITPVNDAPAIGTNDGLTVDEDTTGTITSSKLDEGDPDDSGTGCIYTLTSNTSNGSFKKSGVALGTGSTFTQGDIDNGYITYTHNGSETTSDSFGFTLADGGEDGAGTVSGTFSITVTPVNDPPTLDVNTALSVDEGYGGTIDETNLSASDVDSAASAIFYTVISAPSNGVVKKSGSVLGTGGTFTQTDIASGLITYTHDGSETASDAFGIRLSDGSATQDVTFNITVAPVNDAPVIGTNTGMTLNEDTSKTIASDMLNEADPDDSGYGCVYTLLNAPDNGTLKVGTDALGTGDTFTQADIDNDRLTYTHNGGETTSDAFAVTLADGGEDGTGTVSDSFSIAVTAVNDAPTLDTNTGLGVNEGGSGDISTSVLSASDPDNTDSELVYTITTAPDNGDVQCGSSIVGVGDTFTQVDIAAGRVSYLHDGSDTTQDTVSIRLSDGQETKNFTFSITVTPVNDAPVIGTNTGMTLDEGATDTITSDMLNEADPDDSGYGCVYTLLNAPDNGTLKVGTDALGTGDTFTQADIDNDRLTYTHNGGETTSDAFAVTLADGGEDGTGTVSDSFSIAVTAVNDAPTLDTNTGLGVNEGGSGDISTSVLSASDPDNTDSELVYTITTAPDNGDVQCGSSIVGVGDTFTQVDIVAGRVSYLHDGSDTTQDTVSIRLSDGQETKNFTFSITVTPVNDAPVIGTNTGMTLDEAATDTITSDMLNEDDPDDSGYGCVYTLTDDADNGTLKLNGVALNAGDTFTQADINNDKLTYTHNGGETISDAFTVTLADGGEDGVGTDTQTFSITVTPVNDAPVIVDQTFNVDENASADTVVGTVAVYDAEDDAMTYTITGGNTDGTFSIDEDNGTITVAGTIDHDTIQQYVLDVSVAESDTSEHYGEDITVTVDVNNLHDVPPTPQAADLIAASDSGVSDTDNITNDTTPTFEGGESAAMAGSTMKVYADTRLVGTTTANEDGSWSVTAITLADGTYDITVTSTDNGGDVSETSVVLEVTIDTQAPAADTAPYLASGGSTTDDRTPEIVCNSEAFADVTIYGDSGVLLGTAKADEHGWIFTVAEEDALSVGSHVFTCTLSDDAGNLSPHSPGLAIIVNDPPEGMDVTVTTDEDTIYVFSVEDFGYTDLNDDTFEQIRILALPGHGSLQYYDGAWQSVTARQVVSTDDIAAGYLRFVPEADKNGMGYASFKHKVHDGIDYSKKSNKLTVDVTPVNDVHTLSGLDGDSYDYLEDQDPAVLDKGQNAAIADIDNHNYADGALIVEVTAGGTPREDVIGIDTEDGVITLSNGMKAGSKVSIGGVVVGTVDTVSGKSGKLIVNLGAGSTLTNVAVLMRHITYENSNHTSPSKLERTITLTVEDRDGLYAESSVTVSITRTEKATVTTAANGGVTVSSIGMGGKVTSNGRAKVTEYGVVYSTDAGFDPATEGTRIKGASISSGAFEVKATGLEQNTTYYYAAYAENSEGTSCGSVRSATTYRNSDKDGDGELDNPDKDSDGDGVSDGDEIKAGSDPDDPSSTPSDKDGDGRVDSLDKDSDGDGVSDGDEVAAGSNPDNPSSTPSDKDGDGRVDDPDKDSDGDGISDGDEIAAGSDPDDPSSKPEGQMNVLQPAPAQIPAVPTRSSGMNAWQSTSGSTDTAIALGWDSVEDADHYLIWDVTGGTAKAVGMVDGSGTSCLIPGLEPGTNYAYKIGAYSNGGNGVGSDDKLLGADTVDAVTHGTDGLPLDAIMNEVTGGVPQTPEGRRIDLTGQVTDENGLPLAGLTVELHSNPRTTSTDSGGWYFFDSVEEGEHTVYVYYGETVTEMQLDLQIERDENIEGVEALQEGSHVSFKVNEPSATLVLNMLMNEDGTLSIQHVEAQPVVYVQDGGLPFSGRMGGAIWWIFGGALIIAAGVFIIFFFFIKRRRDDDEEEEAQA